jgi:hypothetical protein
MNQVHIFVNAKTETHLEVNSQQVEPVTSKPHNPGQKEVFTIEAGMPGY